MEEQRFDTLAKDVGRSAGSRRRALRVLAAGLAGAGLLFRDVPEAAAGKAKKRCKNQGGTWLTEGECRCSMTYNATLGLDPCNGDASCRCAQTTGGRGLCAFVPVFFVSADCICDGCPANQRCIVVPGFPDSGRMCETTNECVTVVGPGYGCVDGRCELTACVEPCPTQP